MSRSRAAEPGLTTARLVLRAARAGDLEDLFGIFSDPRAMRYWSTEPHRDRAETAALIDRMIAAPPPLSYVVIERDGRAIGTAGNHRGTEVGFMLHPDHWRQGIVTEAMQAIIPHVFAVTDHPMLTADADPRNAGSVATLKGLGFHETGRRARTFCIAGEWSDSVYFALPRPTLPG